MAKKLGKDNCEICVKELLTNNHLEAPSLLKPYMYNLS